MMEHPLVRRLRDFDWGTAVIIAVDVAFAVAFASAYLKSRGM